MKRACKLFSAILCLVLITMLYTAVPAEDASPAESGNAPVSGDAAEGPVPVWQFCRALSPEGLDTAVITCYLSDCEEGLIPQEITEEEAESIRALAIGGRVTGLASDLCVTGGTRVYVFTSPDGEHLLSVELYEGMLAGPCGMYDYEME